MPHSTLTPRQREILEFVRRQLQAGVCPTVREIAAYVGIRWPNGVLCHLDALDRKGQIRRLPRRARNIRLA